MPSFLIEDMKLDIYPNEKAGIHNRNPMADTWIGQSTVQCESKYK